MRYLLLACSVLLALACGAKQKPRATVPLTPDQLKAFDRGVDFVATLEGLEGRWRDDWDRDLALRVAGSDRIAVVTVRTLRTDTDPQQHVTYRLVVQIDRNLLGDASAKEVELPVGTGEPGFMSVQENLGRIADQQFVAYIKGDPAGTHWHLSPASEPILTETQGKITELMRNPNKSEGERVIVHTN